MPSLMGNDKNLKIGYQRWRKLLRDHQQRRHCQEIISKPYQNMLRDERPEIEAQRTLKRAIFAYVKLKLLKTIAQRMEGKH